jgi:curved DNA-binding protein CbpA
MDDMDGYYAALELKSGASLEEVKRAYKDMVKVWHPDRFSHDPRLQQRAQEKLKEINLAYQRLESLLQDRARPSRPPPKPEAREAGKSRPRPRPRPPGSKKQRFAYQVQAALMRFESALRAVLRIAGIRLPPLTFEGRIKAFLLLLGAIYFVVITIYLVVTLRT